jgi:hypothetical protein
VTRRPLDSVRARLAGARVSPEHHWTGAATLLLAALAGVVTAAALSAASSSEPAVRSGSAALRAGPARVTLPGDWLDSARPSLMAPIAGAATVARVFSEVTLALRAPEHPSLLPRSLLADVKTLPRPTVRTERGRTGWSYPVRLPRRGSTGVAIAVPTTRGVASLTCLVDGLATGTAKAACHAALGRLDVAGAALIRPRPDTAARIAEPAVFAALDHVRRPARRALAHSQSARARAHQARRIAAAYRHAAARLRPLAAGPATREPRILARLAAAHRLLANANLRRDPATARRAAHAIRADERTITAAHARHSR